MRYVRVMNVTEVDFVFVCRRTNFDTFKRRFPELPAVGRGSANKAQRVEHNQYNKLLTALHENWKALEAATSPLAPPAINFRTVRQAVLCVLVISH